MAATRSALFVIDIQNDLASDPQTEIPHAARIRDAGTRILAAARGLVAPAGKLPALIVFVQHDEPPESGPLVKGSQPWKLVFEPRAGADNELLVGKTTGDTFESNPDLADRLKQQGVNHVVAFGVQSECCVEATSKGALNAGFGVTLLRGAHSTYDSSTETALEIERSVEERLAARGASVVAWEDAVGSWQENGVIL